MAGREAGKPAEQNTGGFHNFKILYGLKYSGLFGLISLQCYYSIRSAFQSVFVE